MLAHAYARRKQFEARLIAVEVAKILTGTTTSATNTPQNAAASLGNSSIYLTPSGKKVEVVPVRAMLDQMGVRLDW